MKTKLKFFFDALSPKAGRANSRQREFTFRKFFTVCLLVIVFAQNTKAMEALFQNKIIEFTSTSHPTESNGYMSFQQDIYWKWNDNDTPFSLADLGQETDFTWTATTTGDMEIDPNHVISYNGNEYVIDGSTVYFKGSKGVTDSKGTIRITATNPDYGGVTYSCSYIIAYNMNNTKWSFYSQRLAVGRMKDEESILHNHSNDWELQTYGTAPNQEHVYYYKYTIGTSLEVPASVSTMIAETDGLQFYAPEKKFGVYNESDETGYASDRFVALGVGAEVVIPHSYFETHTHPRVRVKMGRYGGTSGSNAEIDLTIINAKDALGKTITGEGTYVIGGSAWWGDKGDKHQRGEYHFQISDKNQDFKIIVNAGQFLKLYTIEVYDSETMLTENQVLGTSYQLLNRGGTLGNNGASGDYYLHYYGKGERSSVYTNNTNKTTDHPDWEYWPTGTVSCSSSDFVTNSDGTKHTYTSKIGQFGTFRIRLECYTFANNYCTDYAERTMSVGYIESKNYPYTWDFMDVSSYADGAGRMGGNSGNSPYGEADYRVYNRWSHNFLWTNNSGTYGQRLSKDAGGYDVLFCAGSQLWYGTTIIPELAGLGFSTSNNNSVMNETLQILTGTQGVKIDQGNISWWCYRIAVPNVPESGALYVRVHPERSDDKYNAGYSYGDYVKEQKTSSGDVIVQGNYEIPFSSTDQSNVSKTINTTDGTNDIIYVVPGNEISASKNITLYFNGVTIKKIAVSTDPKQVNKYGWATESREHDIDPALTSYMTGQDFRTFLVTSANYNTNTVTLTRIDNQNYLMPDAQNDEGDADDATYFKNACIIQNYAGSAVNILNGGFHLFVPDMHESDVVSGDVARKPIYDTSSSLMKAQLTSGTVAQKESGNANFAFTYGYYDADYNSGEAYSGATEKDGGQAFYRIDKYGASSTGHQGYLSISNPFAAARFTIVFADDEGDNQSVGIVNNKVNKAESESTQYYNLNGQQLNGQPTRQGLYVVNGKKIYVK